MRSLTHWIDTVAAYVGCGGLSDQELRTYVAPGTTTPEHAVLLARVAAREFEPATQGERILIILARAVVRSIAFQDTLPTGLYRARCGDGTGGARSLGTRAFVAEMRRGRP